MGVVRLREEMAPRPRTRVSCTELATKLLMSQEGLLYPPLHEELSLISEPTPTATRVVPFPVLQVASFPARPCTQYTRRRTQEAHRPNRGWMGQLGCTVCHKQAHTAPSVAPSPPPSLLVSLWLVLPLCFAKTHPPPPRRACFHPSHTKTALKRIFSPPQGGSDPPVVEFSIITGKV